MFNNYNIILASGSPRRKELLEKMDIAFEQTSLDIDESFPKELPANEVAEYLAVKKSMAFRDLTEKEILITADTTVIHQNKVLNKAADKAEAREMLERLSGCEHEVVSGVCVRTRDKKISFSSTTSVKFHELTDAEIEHYIERYEPFDKAGAYGIQEWIGLIGIEAIEGSYFTVMGLPTFDLYRALKEITS
ncbi:MAG: Maf family nucleotide pyrophosphatase [Salibacter sp.]|uniref:Maf family nucleotide pyrophosphatase n=1 Tax=Salibacter sp. TaxID=2010995 RepID=UPI0028701692|nr:Maf family nucleotide pyrophosphatase [Salibacter sp.]MDR9399494.1 Maf family nucleotide pyrophosphatase [Salibacter sp.]